MRSPPIHQRDWYTAQEVARLFDVSDEAVRLAGLAGRIPVRSLPSSSGQRWQFPKDEIDSLGVWPDRAKWGQRKRQSVLGEAVVQEVAQEVAALRESLTQERIGRALAEQRIDGLREELRRYKLVLKTLMIDGEGSMSDDSH